MKDKMVLRCSKLKQNSYKPLKQNMFTFTTKTFETAWKMHSEKTVKQKRKLFRQRIEATTRGVLLKKMFIKISQNSQEGAATLLKKRPCVFLRILGTF